MTSSSKAPTSVELDIDAIQSLVSGLRSYGDAIVAGLKNKGRFPTILDSFRQAIDNGWTATGNDLAMDPPLPNWQLYMWSQSGFYKSSSFFHSLFVAPIRDLFGGKWRSGVEASEEVETPSHDHPVTYRDKLVGQIRDLWWGRASPSCPGKFWEMMGFMAWGSTEFQLSYADTIRSLLRERYILSPDERKEVPALSPNTFWLLLSLAHASLNPRLNHAHQQAVSKIRVAARFQAQRQSWAGFWDQWFLGEIFKRRKDRKSFDFFALNQYLFHLPLFNPNSSVAVTDSPEASISIPINKLQETVPLWYTKNIENV
tara:strand:- start:1767 stop:2708 length:942 start_codon:yes stop_codon:yes gene_type:complete